ncbi:MAG: Grx4 family monothiol glutaredoxin [Pseudomonadota bacterium]
MSNSTETKIRAQIAQNPILLYMKGTPENPECGYSAETVKCVKSTGAPFNYVNVLANPFIRERLPSVSNWPTFPQLFVNGELVGGCDIVVEMTKDGSLATLLASVEETND